MMMNLTNLLITSELLRTISEIDEFNGGWKVRNSLNPEYLTKLRHVATIESIGSSTRIEGAKLTDDEVESLLGKVGEESFSNRDEQEVIGYAEVMETVFENFEHISISENYIKQLHSSLLRHSDKDTRHRGEYKKHANNVEAFDALGHSLGIVFETSSAFNTPKQMQDLIVWVRESLEDKSSHPLIVIAVFNVVFLAIHPFQDGNGRLSRVLISLFMLKAGYAYIPYSSLESIIEKSKDAYYLALQRTQKTLNGKVDWQPWLNFFLRALKKQKNHLKIKLDKLEMYRELPSESVLIMQYIDTYGRITISDAYGLNLNVSKPTVKNRVAELVKMNLIERHGKARATWYSKVVK